MRRVMSLWLPSWPTDRLCRHASPVLARRGARADGARPFVTAVTIGSRRLVAAANPAATAAGIAPGLPLADAQAFLPGIGVFDADPADDAASLNRLAEWCRRYSPWTAPDGADGIVLDVTGCAHLWGGEERLLADCLGRVAKLGFAGRAAIADTAGAAWAVARFGAGGRTVVAPGATAAALAELPVAALRLSAETVAGLTRVGLERIGTLRAMPRAALAQRFGAEIARRLDQALSGAGEPLSPLVPRMARRSRLAFAEPIATPEDLARATERLAWDLCEGLAAEGVGARRLELACFRVDGLAQSIAIGTARPSRDPRHLARLLEEKLETIDPGFGIEVMTLAAPIAEMLTAAQFSLARLHISPPDSSSSVSPTFTPSPASGRGGIEKGGEGGRARVGEGRESIADETALAALVDRLGNRLGLANLCRLEPRESHLPERAVEILPALAERGKTTARWPAGAPRPIRLLAPPEPVEATAPVPDDPPILFRWRRLLHRVRRADGPERIAAEWWRASGPVAPLGDPDEVRDYYRVEDATGRRFWLFRAGLFRPGRPARWFVHGVFA